MHENQRAGILAGGNWIIDHVKIVDRYPGQDALASILGESRGTGGSPYNILLDLAKLGAGFPLAGVGLVGDDADGRAILDDCAAHRIDASQIRTTNEASTSYTDVMTVRETGRRTFFHYRGANALLDEGHFDLESPTSRILHIGYLLLLDKLDEIGPDGTTAAARLFKRAGDLGYLTSLDAVSEDSDRFAAVMLPALPYVDFLIVNEFEAGRCTGIDVAPGGKVDFALMEQAAGALLKAGVRRWVVIHCPEGALAAGADGQRARHGSVRVPPETIAGTAGAGDAFAAGMLLGLHEGWPIEQCLRLAVCAAATNLSDPTCTGGILTQQECLALGERLGWR